MADIIERNLKELADVLGAAWRGNRCLSCPLAETAALAAATLSFYREQQAQMKPTFDRWGYPIVGRRVNPLVGGEHVAQPPCEPYHRHLIVPKADRGARE